MGGQQPADTSPEYSALSPLASTLSRACGRVTLAEMASTSSPSHVISLGLLRASALFR